MKLAVSRIANLPLLTSICSLRENYNGLLSDPLGFARQIEDAVNGKGWRAYERVSPAAVTSTRQL